VNLQLSLVCAVVLAHFIADFIAQTDWMALNKSTNWRALTLHVAVYSLIVTTLIGVSGALQGLALWSAVNAAAHFAQDAITSRITAQLWFIRETPTGETGRVWFGGGDGGPKVVPLSYIEHRPTRHWFFVAIGADQCLHYLTLFVTAGWWLGGGR
jgi:hypothetical protein